MARKLFQCEKCNSVHASEKEADRCESTHLEPEKQELVFSEKDRKSEYPSEVKLWFNKKCVTYTRQQ